MSNRLRVPEHPPSQRELLTPEAPPPVRRIWIASALGILLFLALLFSAFSVWVILRRP